MELAEAPKVTKPSDPVSEMLDKVSGGDAMTREVLAELCNRGRMDMIGALIDSEVTEERLKQAIAAHVPVAVANFLVQNGTAAFSEWVRKEKQDDQLSSTSIGDRNGKII